MSHTYGEELLEIVSHYLESYLQQYTHLRGSTAAVISLATAIKRREWPPAVPPETELQSQPEARLQPQADVSFGSTALVDTLKPEGGIRHELIEGLPPLIECLIEHRLQNTNISIDFALAGALAVISALCGNKLHITAWGDVYFANIYLLLVGASGTSYKSSVLAWVRARLSEVAPEKLAAQTGSPEGLMRYLAEQPAAIWLKDELSGLLAEMRGKQYMYDMRPLLLELYSWYGVYARQLAKQTYEALNPALSILATIQPEIMGQELLTESNIRSGLVNRFMFFWGEHQERWPTYREPADYGESIRRRLVLLDGRGVRHLDTRGVQDMLTSNMPNLGEWGKVMSPRRSTHILKIASILQEAADVTHPRVLPGERSVLPLEERWVNKAIAIVDYALYVAASLLDRYGVLYFAEQIRRQIWHWLTQREATSGEIQARFQLSRRQANEYIGDLEDRGWVERVPNIEPPVYRARETQEVISAE